MLGRSVVNDGTIDVANGSLLMLGGEALQGLDWDDLTADFLAPRDFFGLLEGGEVMNSGRLDVANAALIGGRSSTTARSRSRTAA